LAPASASSPESHASDNTAICLVSAAIRKRYRPAMNDNDNEPDTRKLGLGGWIAVLTMLGFLVWAIWYAVHAWTALEGIGISTMGWVSIALGLVFTIALGAGLMALVFYSSRKNYDR
jgi:hypothetical protein